MARWVVALRLTGVGFFIGGSIVLGVFTGIWIDSKLDMAPVFTLLGRVFGIIIAGFGVYQMLIPLLKNWQDKENGECLNANSSRYTLPEKPLMVLGFAGKE